ncbi:MAG TPA: GH92 family glycosyl hydrolase [Vicinamibacterales bacterium]|nr:GH92 family glycosyl hydrolase [Vicinamibacterales bacterium]
MGGTARRLVAAAAWLAAIAGLSVCTAPPPSADRLTSYVNPFIGTGSHGHTFPGPSLPFGMIQPGPDTRETGWDSSSGYHDSDSRILGFSHTHLSGTGIPDYGDVLVMPVAGGVRLDPRPHGTPGYSSAFSHTDERAEPGYYAVTLADSGIRAELTSTLRVALHRYALPRGRRAYVVVDLAHRDEVLEASLDVAANGEITGTRRSRSWAKDQRLSFVMRFSRPVTVAASGTPHVSILEVADGEGPLLVKVAISAVSVDGARRNLEAELPGWDFDAVRRAASDAWEHALGRIRVDGGTRDQRVVFYTALYHAMLTPNMYMDVDGQYRGRDLAVHRAEGFTYYSVFSLWDTFRALHPLLTLIDRAHTADFVKTMLRQYQDVGRLPVWELAANETDTMIGYHAVPVIADAILKGVEGIDAALALEAMMHSADEDRAGLASYKARGYVDGSGTSESVSRTLEYAYDDWCIAIVAQKLGRTADAARFFRRAQNWRNVFDPSTGFMRARVDGHWFSPFDPAEVNFHYTEANAWQYSFFVPQDLDGLRTALGGPDALARKLDALFAASSQTTGRDQADITGLVGQYAHGNEPSHHIAYLYDYAGQPWKTQAMVRRLVDTMYSPQPDGEIGNDDCGQMSAWLVFGMLGFYPVTPGSDEYAIGRPVFPRATIHLENGRDFVVRADGASPRATYIREAHLNGAAYSKSFLPYAAVSAGGDLVFQMSATPNTSWASGPDDRPHSSIPGPTIVAAPFVAEGSRVFRGQTTVTLGDLEPNLDLRYTLDGSPATASSATYATPLTLTNTTTMRVLARRANGEASLPFEVGFHKIPDGRTIRLSARYANQYSAGGDDALIDGLRGSQDFRDGRWQGYRGTDLTATVDLGSVQPVHRVTIGFLRDVTAWIMLPRSVCVWLSVDGDVSKGAPCWDTKTSDRDPAALQKDAEFDFPSGRAARYVHVSVERYGPLPDWHPGKGEEAWFFADEIVIR